MQLKSITAAVFLLASMNPVFSATVVYSDAASWLANVSNVFTYGGPTVAPGGSANYHTSSGLIIPELQITGNRDALWTLSAVNAATNGSQPWYQWNSGTIFRSDDKIAGSNVWLTINFATAVRAFGFNYGAGGSGGAPASMSILTTGQTLLNVTSQQQPVFGFYGIVSDTALFSSVNIYINDLNRYVILDNISTGELPAVPPPGEVPEAATILYLLTGLGLIVYGHKNRQPRTQESAG